MLAQDHIVKAGDHILGDGCGLVTALGIGDLHKATAEVQRLIALNVLQLCGLGCNGKAGSGLSLHCDSKSCALIIIGNSNCLGADLILIVAGKGIARDRGAGIIAVVCHHLQTGLIQILADQVGGLGGGAGDRDILQDLIDDVYIKGHHFTADGYSNGIFTFLGVVKAADHMAGNSDLRVLIRVAVADQKLTAGEVRKHIQAVQCIFLAGRC